jgi:hypothetical protein
MEGLKNAGKCYHFVMMYFGNVKCQIQGERLYLRTIICSCGHRHEQRQILED